MIQRTCAVCGASFSAKRGDAHYCSAACRKRKQRAQNDNYLYARKEYLKREISILAKMLKHPDDATAMECRYYLIELKNMIDSLLAQ